MLQSMGRKASDTLSDCTEVNDDPICKAAKETDVKNRLLASVGEGESGMI